MDLAASLRQRLRLVQLSRQLAGRRPVLFHGTRYPASIARSGVLLFATSGDPVISFSRSLKSRHIGPTCRGTMTKDAEPCSSSTGIHWRRGIV